MNNILRKHTKEYLEAPFEIRYFGQDGDITDKWSPNARYAKMEDYPHNPVKMFEERQEIYEQS